MLEVLQIIGDNLSCIAYGFEKGCTAFTRQREIGTGKVLDLCEDDRENCPWYNGPCTTNSATEPLRHSSRSDFGFAGGVRIGSCRFQKDAIHVGPIIFFDKRLLHPTPPR